VEKLFRNLEEVLDWIDRNQLARRNLTDAQFLVVVGRLDEREKRQGERTDLTCGQNDHKFQTSAENQRKFQSKNPTAERIATNAARARVLGRLYERRKRQGERTDLTCGQNDHKFEGQQATARRIATEFGIGEKTVRRAASFARAYEQLEAEAGGAGWTRAEENPPHACGEGF